MWTWRGMPTNSGVNFGREFLGEAWNTQKTRPKNLRRRFAIKIRWEIRWEIRQQFSLNSRGLIKKFTPNPLCRTSGSLIRGTQHANARSGVWTSSLPLNRSREAKLQGTDHFSRTIFKRKFLLSYGATPSRPLPTQHPASADWLSSPKE